MNHYGCSPRTGCTKPFINLMKDVLSDFTSLFPKDIESLEHLMFVVEYGSGLDRDLGFHVDASDITLNCVLEKNF